MWLCKNFCGGISIWYLRHAGQTFCWVVFSTLYVSRHQHKVEKYDEAVLDSCRFRFTATSSCFTWRQEQLTSLCVCVQVRRILINSVVVCECGANCSYLISVYVQLLAVLFFQEVPRCIMRQCMYVYTHARTQRNPTQCSPVLWFEPGAQNRSLSTLQRTEESSKREMVSMCANKRSQGWLWVAVCVCV